MTGKLDGLAPYTPYSREDAARWARLRAFVAAGVEVYTRSTAHGGHVTASAFVLSPDMGSVLLTHHRKLDMWLQLGGHCDGIVDTRFVALKEAYEESGLRSISLVAPDILDVDCLPVPAFGDDPAHLHYDVRYLMRAGDMQITVSAESHDLAWVPLRDLESVTQELTMLRLRDAALRWL
ncbi:MAG: NUDIX hydrolase [Pseudomonadota bacterium]